MESLNKPVVTQEEHIKELWRLTNLEMFLGRNVVGQYFNSVNVQLEIPYEGWLERINNA